jgi:hypothetical protein
MPFCPKCRDEFQDWVKVCPDCKVALVDKLKDIPKTVFQDEPLVHIATAPNEAVAGMWAGILENNGISCVLKSDNLRSAYYFLLTNHYFTIHVLDSKALQAKEILSPLEDDLNDYVISRGNCLSLTSRIFIVVVFLLWAFGGI